LEAYTALGDGVGVAITGRSRTGSAAGGVYAGAGSSSLPLCLLDHMDTLLPPEPDSDDWEVCGMADAA
jgi:hypothetical protein